MNNAFGVFVCEHNRGDMDFGPFWCLDNKQVFEYSLLPSFSQMSFKDHSYSPIFPHAENDF